ncbi:MAG: GntR family transcriptional regulator [Nitrospiraceae bacterium]|nr:GntR family transcriptional regulator [Nitrospiraceae bacterium]
MDDIDPKAILPAMRLDKASPVPMYFQIAEGIREAIESGTIHSGQRLENEYRLSELLGVSRPTVRQAVQQLVQQGLLQRQRGVGTIVASRKIPRPVALTSLYDDLSASGRKPQTKVLSVEVAIPDPDVAKELGIGDDEQTCYIERLRFADGEPLAWMTNYLPISVIGNSITQADLEMNGLYEVLRQRGIKFALAEQVIGARKATAREASLLGVQRGATLITMVRVAYDGLGRAIEFGRHAYIADKYSVKMSLVAEG